MKRLLTLLFTLPLLNIVVAQQSEVSFNFNEFSLNLHKQLTEKNENLFFSPFSINIALRMVWEGSAGHTRSEFEKVLQFSDEVSEHDVIDFFTSPKSGVENWTNLRLANALWLDDQFDIRVLFQQEMQKKYRSDIYTLDFKYSAAVADSINHWVSRKTEGTIPEMLNPSDITPETALIIANAIYFYGEWAHKFDKYKTKDETFYSIDKTEQTYPFMNRQGKYRYYNNKHFRFVSIPYQGNNKSFCILLPKKKYGIGKVEKKLKAEKLETIFTDAKMEEVNLSLPKFKMETSYDLVDPLKALGLKQVFTNSANLSGINEVLPLKVGSAKHKAFIEVDEEKTEAAAATTIGVALTSVPLDPPKPIEFKADHPFIYMIVDNKTNGILFMGRYVE